MECKLQWVNFRKVSDPRRAFQPDFKVTGVSDNWYISTLGVIVIGLGTPRSAAENIECTLKYLVAPATGRGALATSLGASGTAINKPGSTSDYYRPVWESDFFFGNIAGTFGNHIHYLSFNDFQNSCIPFAFWSMYQYSYPSTISIAELAAGGAWEKFKIHLKMTIECTQKYTARPWLSKYRDELGSGNGANSRIHVETVIKWTSKWILIMCSRGLGDALGGHDHANFDGLVEEVWR